MSGWFPGAAGAATSSRRRQPDVLEIVPDHRRPDAADAATDCVEGRPAVEERVGGFIVEKPPQLAIELVAAGGIEPGGGPLLALGPPRVLHEDRVGPTPRLCAVPDTSRTRPPAPTAP